MSDLFGPDFLWGVAQSGHQTEGGDADSDSTFAESVQPTVFREPAGIACDSYRRWREDVDLAASLGLNAYRFSIEWSRIEATRGEISTSAIDHYEEIVDHCLSSGLTPVVTLSHFTTPHWFAADSGWLNPDAPQRFANYADLVFARLADRVQWIVTLNEPNLPHLISWLGLPQEIRDLEHATLAAASQAAGVERYRLANVVLASELDLMAASMADGHKAASAAVKAHSSDVSVGFTLSVVDDVACGSDTSVRDRKRHECYLPWLELARDDDFLGLQNYERMRYDDAGEVPAPADLPRNQMGSAVEPESLAAAARYAHEVAQVPIVVTEHGIATDDDAMRGAFIRDAVDGLGESMRTGVPVLGYFHWTLLDNFEWVFGYGQQLGLVEVDRTTFDRTPKPSAAIYAEVVRSRRAG